MTDFAYLKEDGTVQKTVYGGGRLTAVGNFGDDRYVYEKTEIPPHSVLIEDEAGRMVYTPSLEEGRR